MAGPKISWFRCQYDYWKYFARERRLTLASCLLLGLSIIGISPLGPNFGYRDGISYIGIVGSLSILWLEERRWKNDIKKMTVFDVKRRVEDIAFVVGAKIYGRRPFIVNEDVNKAIRSHCLRNKPVLMTAPYELHADARKKAIKLLEYFHLGYFHGIKGRPIKMWNDEKVRLHTSPSVFLEDSPVELKKTSYFDYLGTGFFSLRECHYDNDLFYDGESLMKKYGGLASLRDTKTAHHIGVNALLITADKKILYQETEAPAAPDNQAPSGSGSLDVTDIDVTSFEKTLLTGALRELSEETGWNDIAEHGKKAKLQKVENMFSWPLGMSVDISRGLVTDFFFVVMAETDAHEEYMEYYRDGKVKLDTFELKTKNSIQWKSVNTENMEALQNSIVSIFEDQNVRDNSMMSISLWLLLKAIEEQTEVSDRLLMPYQPMDA